MFVTSPKIGLLFILMIDALFFIGGDLRYDYESYILTLWLLLSWGILAWRCYQFEVAKPEPTRPAMEVPTQA